MDIKLIIIGGKANKSQVALTLPTVIGRSREADLTVAHPMISRKHCELYEMNGLVMVRDFGSLNGLFVGGRQVNEAALQPNSEFTVGPLTFRVEYQYAQEIAVEPDATTINETYEPPPPATSPEAGDFDVVDRPEPIAEAQALGPDGQTPAVQAEPAAGESPPEPAEIPATIAPPDGQLPDFSAWGVEDAEPDQQQPAAEPLPPPTVSLPETAAFEPGELAELGQTHQPAIDVAEGDQPPEAPGVEPGESEAPPIEPPTDAADEETRESTVGPAPQPDKAPEEGMFDLALPPTAEPDDSGEAGTGDEALDDFLKGLE